MSALNIFLSVVVVVRNQAEDLAALLQDLTKTVSPLATDYELVVIDNASTDNSATILQDFTKLDGLPNLQVFTLTKQVQHDVAVSIGLENALGDFVTVIDPLIDDIHYLPTMLEHATGGVDVVFAENTKRPKASIGYRLGYTVFNALYKKLNGVNLMHDAPQYRLLSRRVVNFLLQHPQPALNYRHLPATGGFTRANLTYTATPKLSCKKQLGDRVDQGLRLLISNGRAPMRLVTMLSLFGAMANVVYSIYVIGVAMMMDNVAAGWVTLSLQQSGMFFLLSLVLLVLGEYILHMTSLVYNQPQYHVAQEFTSARMTRQEKLNIEEMKGEELPITESPATAEKALEVA